jgi:hypothetical protein
VEMNGLSRREKRSSFLMAIAVGLMVMLVGAPVVQAAVQEVKVKNAVKVKDSDGDNIQAEDVPDMGLLDVPGYEGALTVRNTAGGGGLLGTGDCTAAAGQPTDIRPNTTTVAASADTVVTGIIITGSDAKVSVSAPDLNSLIGPGPVVNFQTTAENQNVFIGLGNGLTVFPSELVFTCTGAGGGDGSGNYVILGQ